LASQVVAVGIPATVPWWPQSSGRQADYSAASWFSPLVKLALDSQGLSECEDQAPFYTKTNIFVLSDSKRDSRVATNAIARGRLLVSRGH
jgi:hypothetical protein